MSIPARSPNMIPLGLFSLGIAVFLVAAQFCGWIDTVAFIPYGIFTGGAGMVLSGVLALREDNPFAGTAFCVVGSFFASAAFFFWFFAGTAKNPGVDLAWTALAWAIVLLLLAIGSFSVPRIPLPGKLMWLILFLAFLFAWISAAFHMDWARPAASVAGIIVAILAWIGGYGSLRLALAEDGTP